MKTTTVIIPSIGRTVHFVLPNGMHRPAVITNVFGETPGALCNIKVTLDGTNDWDFQHEGRVPDTIWRTSVHQDDETKMPGTWHAPEQVG